MQFTQLYTPQPQFPQNQQQPSQPTSYQPQPNQYSQPSGYDSNNMNTYPSQPSLQPPGQMYNHGSNTTAQQFPPASTAQPPYQDPQSTQYNQSAPQQPPSQGQYGGYAPPQQGFTQPAQPTHEGYPPMGTSQGGYQQPPPQQQLQPQPSHNQYDQSLPPSTYDPTGYQQQQQQQQQPPQPQPQVGQTPFGSVVVKRAVRQRVQVYSDDDLPKVDYSDLDKRTMDFSYANRS